MTLKPSLAACHQTPHVQKRIPTLTLQPGICWSNTVPRETNGERVPFSLEDDSVWFWKNQMKARTDTVLDSKDKTEGRLHIQVLFKQHHKRGICVQGN